ncbi:MAG: polyphosphate kinase 1, partial [Tannerellaceae bacterium]|nr:polyphosphate kinase 1 [Tannerellaceae bacterium]
VYILSADWMTRNLDNRIEAAVPILDEEIRTTIKEVFRIQWSDNVKARDLSVLGRNNYVSPAGREPCRSQLALYEYYESKAQGIV